MNGHTFGQTIVPGLTKYMDIVSGCQSFADMEGISFCTAGDDKVPDQNGYFKFLDGISGGILWHYHNSYI